MNKPHKHAELIRLGQMGYPCTYIIPLRSEYSPFERFSQLLGVRSYPGAFKFNTERFRRF